MVKNAGVTDIWIAGFLYGHWYFSLPRIQKACQMVGAMGMNPQVINLPLGHPGDSLGAQSEEVPLGPPANWRMGVKVDGSQRSGTSIHPPPADENSRALKDLQVLGVRKVFLDDDFRLAVAPGMIGGCFCAEHRQRFLEKKQGLQASDWEQLLQDVENRADGWISPVMS